MNNWITLPVPTPFPVGPINIYLTKKDPITLIDCGPNTLEAKGYIKARLAMEGLKIEDIKQIIITHGHPDHFGLAAELQQISKAKIYIHNKDIAKAQNRYKHLERISAYLSYAGLPEAISDQLKDYFKWDVSLAEPLAELIGVEDGHIFSFDGFDLKGLLTPGHSVGHLCLFQKDEGLLFAGDTILDGITPNPVLEPFVDQPLQREKSLQQYIKTLQSLESLEIKCLLTGHGNAITEVARVFRFMHIHHQRRKGQILKIAARYKEFQPYEITAEVYRKLKRPVDFYLGLSEVIVTSIYWKTKVK